MTRSVIIRKAAIALLALLMVILGGPLARAQSVTNTAQATWQNQGQGFSVTSNTVAFNVLPQPVNIETFAQATTGGTAFSFIPSHCAAAPAIGTLSQPASLTTTARPSSEFHAGDTFYFRIVLASGNTNPAAVDSINVVLTGSSGDLETINVFETGPNTGIFAGSIATRPIPAAAVSGDCRLSVAVGDKIRVSAQLVGQSTPVAEATVNILADPFGLVFDSEDGSPVDGAKVSIVDAATGAPAAVYAPDGVTLWPSTVYTGQAVTDAAGNTVQLPSGEYRFPLVAQGSYRIVVEPPAPYHAPSALNAAQLAGLTRIDGSALVLNPASWGGTFTLSGPQPVQVDVPVDRPPVSVTLTKIASRRNAQPGDVVFYTVTARNPDPAHAKRAVTMVDVAARELRLRPDSVRIDGAANPSILSIAPDGSSLTVNFGTIPGGGSRTVTYAMTVRADAAPGQALNKVETTDSRGLKSFTSAVVQIDGDNLTSRMTIIGRITDGGCTVTGDRRGVPGVQVVMEDGSYAITDAEGRYHLDGVVPGTHVVAAQEQSLPEGGKLVNCGRSTREAGSASSRFVRGQGGSLAVADFHAELPATWRQAAHLNAGLDAKAIDGGADGGKDKPVHTIAALQPGKGPIAIDDAAWADRVAAGAETDWMAMGDGPPAFLFPAVDHNPRAPVVRAVIRHKPDQKVELMADGKPVDRVSFDAMRRSPNGAWAVSSWRAIPLTNEVTHLAARVINHDGTVAAELTRDVHFNTTAFDVQVVPEQTHLVADGRTRPVIALRIRDRQGNPVHAGISGEFSLSAPYESAESLDMMQSRALVGLGRTTPHWTVKGDDGIALVELAPTMVSGSVQLDFDFADNKQLRHQTLNAWVVPGDIKWTLVGLAEGSVGAKTVADAMQRTGKFDSDLGDHARTAFYAKGRVLGKYLVTLAYDSAKQRADTQLLGTIDPRAYYTVFADGSDRRFDAASRNKLYVRVESREFFAMFGDFQTGFNQTQLARYQRTGTGVKGELHMGGLHAQAYATRIASAHRRDEIQGAGISGPYALSSPAIIANSETIAIEVRDRFRSEKIVSTQTLTRFIDYDVDLLAGTITFKAPVLSRDADLNPQFIVADYEVDTNVASGALNAGVRVDMTTAKGKLRIGATALTDTGNGPRTELGGVDVKAKISQNTELRAEFAASHSAQLGTNTAWLVEAEHHDRKLDVLAYARSMDRGYGVGQANGAESGRRKFGVDARYSLNDNLSLIASGWLDNSLTDNTRRDAVQLKTEYRTASTDFRAGISRIDDHLADGTTASSTVLDAGVSRRLLHNRLELDASGSIALGSTQSVDLPSRYQFSARYALTHAAKLTGTYEIASGSAIDARTARIGIELAPWRGARLSGGMGEQDIAEYGKRSFASFGLAQSVDVTRHLSLDGSLESTKVLGGVDLARVINPAHPLTSGGQINANGALTEDFTAITAGAAWREDRWTVTLRSEWRDGEFAKRKGVTFGAIRQLGDGSMVGSGVTWTSAHGSDASSTEVLTGALAFAHRPSNSDFATLTKVELRSDKVTGANGAMATNSGRTALSGIGDMQSTRIIGSVSTNWSPKSRYQVNGNGDDEFVQRTEIGLFGAVRYGLDKSNDLDLQGTSLFGGLDVRIGLGDRLEFGGTATVRTNLSDHTTSFAFGPEIGIAPARDVLLTVGYNIVGFRDRDFSAARTTEEGLFATLRMKFDTSTLGWLGLNR
ncbi:MAG: DUF11 domain-containing protein [Proteobacteria bacterium]|nr:DUF11 domain-containing protein [Pseudomonadota bacterium]